MNDTRRVCLFPADTGTNGWRMMKLGSDSPGWLM